MNLHDQNGSSDESPRALLPLEIPGHTGPLDTGEWGINIAAAKDNFPHDGLQVFIPAWTVMNPGDKVEVLLDANAITVASEVIDPEEVDKRVTLFVASARFNDGFTTISHRVTRVDGQTEQGEVIKLYVKLTRPGGQDQSGDTPGHSELHMVIPEEIIQNGVDKDTAKAGVPITIKPYPNIAENDIIRLSWGGQIVTRTVSKVEASDPENNPISMRVEEAVILKAGDSGPEGLAVTFEVDDVVENESEDWSAEIRIFVDTDETRLEAPVIKEANGNNLDLGPLGSDPIHVQVLATAAPFAVGDQIVVNLKGTAADSKPVDISLPPLTISQVPGTVELPMANASVRLLAKSQGAFSYRLIKADQSAEMTSKGRFINILGEITRLAAPIAKDASQGTLNPDLPSTGIDIPWDDAMAAGQLIDLKWLGKRPDLSIYFPELDQHPITNGEADAKQPITLTVPGEHLTPINGGTLELYYELLSVTRALVTRESLHAAVLNVGEPRAELPAPDVEGDVDNVLDPEKVPTGTRLIVPMYTGITAGDEVHYEWKGSKSGTHTDWLTLNTQTAQAPVPFSISFELINNNLNGTVDASYYVVRANGAGTSVSNVLALQVSGSSTLKPATITSIKDSNGSEIPNNGSTTDTQVVITGTAQASKTVEIYDGSNLLNTVSANASEVWTLTVNNLSVASHAIKARGVYGDLVESPVRTFTVTAASTRPSITSIKDSTGLEIPDNGSTADTSVVVTGKAQANQTVEIFDDLTSKGTQLTNESEVWSLTLTNLSVAAHSIKAKALYGDGAESAVRKLTVIDDSGRVIRENFDTHPDITLKNDDIYDLNHFIISANGSPYDCGIRSKQLFLNSELKCTLKETESNQIEFLVSGLTLPPELTFLITFFLKEAKVLEVTLTRKQYKITLPPGQTFSSFQFHLNGLRPIGSLPLLTIDNFVIYLV
ncbi:MAG TPA: hypothetical protein VGC62_12675 [Pseudomonas sp.]|uniref:hypothetical protein n=1 Tax=Pseudomonas sp. TaxID=306 RepID=UPI002EDB69D7